MLDVNILQARPESIAFKAKVSASSETNDHYRATNVIDGVISVKGQGCWKSDEKNVWIQLKWEKKQLINKIAIYNSPNLKSQVKSGKLEFSDGSSIIINLLTDGSFISYEFEEKVINQFRFFVLEGNEESSCLSEIEVFNSPNQFKEPVEWVDPYIETNKRRFFFFITGQRPYGMINAAHMTKKLEQWRRWIYLLSKRNYGFSSNPCMDFFWN